MTPSPARRAAHEALRDVHARGETLAAALDRARRGLQDARDRALAGEIAYGVCRWQAQLDHLVSRVSTRGTGGIDDAVLDVLRAAVYQLLHLDRIPRHAVVADAVSLTRAIGHARAAGFVNAILRAVAGARVPLALPVAPTAPPATRRALVDHLSVMASHPRWLIERWVGRHGGAAAAAWTRFNNRAAPLALRPVEGTRTALQAALAEAGVTTRPTHLAPDGLVVTGGNPLSTPLADGRRFVVQAEASQLVTACARALVASPSPGPVLDLCAAPGGKTVGLATAGARPLVVAADFRPRRVSLVASTLRPLRALRTTRTAVVRLDATAPLPFGPVFGGVLVDAPCSGLGTLGRDPDIRWRRVAADLPAFAERQLRMLTRAAAVVRPHGWVLYVTCSSEPEENEAVVRRFLDAHPDYHVRRPPPAFAPVVDGDGFLRTLPFRDGVDAFFAATLRRKAP